MFRLFSLLLLLFPLTSCASVHHPDSTAHKMTRAAEYVIFVPLCFLHGVCPDLSDDDDY